MKKPIAVILTDTHLKEENTEINKSVFKQAATKALELGLKQIFHGGDIFNSRKGQVIPNLSTFEEILNSYEEAGIKLKAIPGNHDKTDYDSECSFLDPFKHHPAFELYDEMSQVEWAGDVLIWVAPFFSDDQYLSRWVTEENAGRKGRRGKHKNVLLTHIGMNGAIMNNGIAIESKINEELFKDFDRVLIGHYHNAMRYSDKIHYIGSSIQHNFGETPNKGLTVLYDDLSTELMPLDFPKYTAFEVNAKSVTIKDIEEIKKQSQESGDHIRIILTGAEKDVKAFDKQRLLSAGISVVMKQDEVTKDELESRVEPFNAASLSEAFKEFCKRDKLDYEQGCKYFNKIVNV